MTTTTGYDAIELARTSGATLSKYADPTEPARDRLTVEEAEEIAAEDASLIYCSSASQLDGMSPNDAWEGYVGAQSPREFYSFSEETSPALAARSYVLSSPMCAELDADDKDLLSDLLGDHITANLDADR